MQKITFGEGALPGYEIGDKTLPALIVIQEWWGVNDTVKELAVQFNQAGFRCLIPDLYKGKIGVDAEEAHHLMTNLNFKDAVAEIKQAADYLRSTGSPKVGITGFCMGGALTFAAMAEGANAEAGAPFYGIPDAKYFDITKIKAPLLAQFGEKDAHKGFSDVESAIAAGEKIKAAGGDIQVHIYASAGHGFMNALCGDAGIATLAMTNNPVPTDEDLQLAKTRLVDFMHKHLG